MLFAASLLVLECYILLPMIFDALNYKVDETSSILVVLPLCSLMQDQVNVCEPHKIRAVAVTRENDESKCHRDVYIKSYLLVLKCSWAQENGEVLYNIVNFRLDSVW